MEARTVFVTNVTEYAGAPAAAAMAKAGWTVFGHDESFGSAQVRLDFERDNPGHLAAAAQDPAAFIDEGLSRFGRIDALISNDIPRGTSHLRSRDFSSGDTLDEFEAYLDTLAIEPVRLLRAALPSMVAARTGSIVLITSGAPLRVPASAIRHGYNAGRAAANSLAKSLAVELAPYNIQVNAVAPFLVYSQTFFPSIEGAADTKYAPLVEKLIPMGRFGAPEEIGELIAHLATGTMSFVSGQVIAFSGAGC